MSISPRPASGGFQHWELGELLLVPSTSKADEFDDDETIRLEEIEVWQADGFVADEGYKFVGGQRLRILVGVPPGMRRARFRYYFEVYRSSSS